ncbi:MAG: mechanosensitive ion channel, partial [Desulfuromonadales bacterium]|nr:mechanosensitive ion channel [Desulfuromonadales bacterium]NIS39514.1 mechanosensitive ion channel [Desulfuromonadales bacterium]
GTVFLMLFALMGLRLAEGAVELFFRSQLVSASRFARNLGADATVRFVRLFRIIIWGVAALYLLEVWGLFDDVYSAWAYLLGLEYAVGEFRISVKMIVLVVVVLYLSIMVSWFFQSFLEAQVFYNKRIDRGVRDAFKKLSHYAIILVGFIVAMTMAGIKLQNFAILAGAFGIGIGFGLQNIVNNFVSGLILLFERPVKVGDALIIDGQWGAVVKIGMRSTVVETWDRSELIVPNSQMISEKVLNWTLSSNVSRVTVKVGVKYGTDLEKVIKILNKVGDGHPAVVEDPAPSAIFTEFGDSSINFELRVWVDNIKNRLTLISDMGVEISKEFKKAGIEIPFPQRDLHLKTVAP